MAAVATARITRLVRAGLVIAVSGVMALGVPAFASADGGHSVDVPPEEDVSAQSILKVMPVDGATNDGFGMSVAVSGDIAVIGSPGDDTVAGIDAGSANVYVRYGTNWAWEAKLTALDAAASDAFGGAVAVYGDTIMVGADMDNMLRGAVYVFTRSGGVWSQQQKIVPASASSNDHVGIDVALYQDTAVIGTWAELAYVYTRSGPTWTQQAVLTDPAGVLGDSFGHPVALYRDTAIVGARYDDAQRGSACIFTRAGTAWGFQQKLVATDAAVSDYLGGSVAIWRDTALVGAIGDDDTGDYGGAAYVFERSGTTWTQRAKLTSATGDEDDVFGCATALSGDTAVVGASGVESNRGAVYLFSKVEGTWQEIGGSQAPDGVANDYYGGFVGLSGGKIVVGAWGDDDMGSASGSAHLYIAEPTALPGITRVAGDNRYLTAVEASHKAFPFGASAVVLATGENWPDALGGSALAGAVRGPILLTPSASLPPEVEAEIVRLGASRVYVLGGTVAVSADVENTLIELMGAQDVVRLAGDSRYETAEAVADETIALMGSMWGRNVFVATGTDFPDATAAAPIAACYAWPVVLAAPDSTGVYRPPLALQAYILGGTAAVSEVTEGALVAEYGPTHVERLHGEDRYATAAAVAQFGYDQCMTWRGVGLASGTAFPDALSGGSMLGIYRSVLLLTSPTELSSPTREKLEANTAGIAGAMHVIGGEAAVSPEVEAEAELAAGL